MTQFQEFRIYPSQESYLSNSPDWTALSGHISFEQSSLVSEDGKQYRLNFGKFSLNDALADLDLNAPVSKVTWFIPKDPYAWYCGHIDGVQHYAYKFLDRWYGVKKNTTVELNGFIPMDNKRAFKRCLKIVRFNGTDNITNCYIWETPKYLMQQLAEKKLRFTKAKASTKQLAVAFVDDENGTDVIGYIYPAQSESA